MMPAIQTRLDMALLSKPLEQRHECDRGREQHREQHQKREVAHGALALRDIRMTPLTPIKKHPRPTAA